MARKKRSTKRPRAATDDGGEEALRLGDLQLAILRVLWTEGEATAVRVHEVVAAERSSSASTIATMLGKMETRGLVTHRKEGRRFIFSALVAEDQARRSMVRDVTSRMFGGDVRQLLRHLVREDEIGENDLEAISEMLDRGVEDDRPRGEKS